MMKPVKRVFLILGAMSMFSLFQFDAMGLEAYDKSPNCTSGVSAGLYCKKKNYKHSCPAGCWCESGRKDAIGEKHSDGTIALVSWCRDHTKYLETYLSERGVHYCPDDFPKSGSGASSITHCHNENGIYYSNVTAVNCPNNQAAGKFCKNIDFLVPISQDCRPGCYCTGDTKKTVGFRNVEKACNDRSGATDLWAQLNDGHVYLCPEGFPYSAAGAKKEEDCFKLCKNNKQLTYKAVYCAAGKYLPKLSVECDDCPQGYRCPGTILTGLDRGPWFPSCEGDQGLVACPSGRVPNSDHTECINSTGGGGGNTGGNGTNCANGQYLFYGAVVHDDIAQRIDINSAGIEDVAPVLKRTNPNNNKAFAETNANNDKASGETKANLSRSVVSRAAKSLPDVGQSAPKSALVGMGGTCKDCDAGYYCPDRQHRYRCEDGTYTSATGQTSCQPCNGTVTHPANNSSLNTGCSTVPDNPGSTTYTVTYKCGEGSGTSPTDSNPYAYGASVTLKSKGNCTAPSAKPNFGGWNCGNNISGQAGDTITMPAANVICTAQWTAGSGGDDDVTCPAGKYLPVGGTLLADCVVCPAGNYCLGNNDHTECTGDTYINVVGSTSASDCHSCPSGEHAVDNHTGCSSNVVHCVAGKYLGANNQCVDCEEGYVCPGGYFEPGSNINGLRLPTDYCNSNQVVNIAQTDCETCTGGAAPNSTQTQCVAGNADCGLGKYVDDDGVCKNCPSNRFCPGNGNYYTCPFGSPTYNKASCSFSLNESKLYHGQSTSGNCWKHLNNASNYRDCMYGFHLESLRGN